MPSCSGSLPAMMRSGRGGSFTASAPANARSSHDPGSSGSRSSGLAGGRTPRPCLGRCPSRETADAAVECLSRGLGRRIPQPVRLWRDVGTGGDRRPFRLLRRKSLCRLRVGELSALCAGWLNSSKNSLPNGSVLDPYAIGDGWFEVILPSLQLVLTDKVPPEFMETAQRMLVRPASS